MPQPTIQIGLKVEGLKEVLSNFAKAPAMVKRELNNALDSMAIYLQGQSKIESPIKTGRLRSSIYYQTDHNSFYAMVATNVYYAIFVHEGTRYIKANPFMARAASKSQGYFNKKSQDMADAIARGLAR